MGLHLNTWSHDQVSHNAGLFVTLYLMEKRNPPLGCDAFSSPSPSVCKSNVFQSHILKYIMARFAQRKPRNPMFKVPQETKADTISSLFSFYPSLGEPR